MIRRFTKRVIHLTSAAAVSLTVASTPVSAGSSHDQGNNDIAALIAALLGVATIGALISDNGNTYEPAPTIQPKPRDYHGHDPRAVPRGKVHRHSPNGAYHRHGPAEKPRGVYKPVSKPAPKPRVTYLPQECLRDFRTQFGRQTYWGKRCLKNNDVRTKRLPQSCADEIVVRNRRNEYVTRNVFEPTCMRANGFFPNA